MYYWLIQSAKIIKQYKNKINVVIFFNLKFILITRETFTLLHIGESSLRERINDSDKEKLIH